MKFAAKCSIGTLVFFLSGCGTNDAHGDAGTPEDADNTVDVGPAADAGPMVMILPGPDAAVAGGGWFEDLTDSAGILFSRIPRDGYGSLPDRMSGGVCVIDVDGRAPLDLFFALRPSASGGSRLYVGQGPFDYADETASRGLSDVGDAFGCLAFDADGDGDEDLLVTGLGQVRFFQNDGGTFSDQTALLGLALDSRDMYMSAAAGDLDGDSDLDIYVAGFLRFDTSGFLPGDRCGFVPCPAAIDAHVPIADLLLMREGGSYVERSAALAPDLTLEEPGLCAAISDLDQDGSPDIFVGNDLGVLYFDRVLKRQGDGTFMDVAPRLGYAYNARAYGVDTMGWATGDINGDGVLDHAATSFETDPTSIYICSAEGFCEEQGADLGTVALSHTFRWAVAMIDVDLDGDLDLLESTGHLNSAAELVAIGFLGTYEQPLNLMENRDHAELVPVVPGDGDGLFPARTTRGMAVVDLDDDGRLDVVLAPADGKAALLRNVRAPEGHWLRVKLVGLSPNTAAAGALVTAWAGERRFVAERSIGEGYLGNFDPRLHFGLGAIERVRLEVRWPSGAINFYEDIPADAEIVIRQSG